MNEQIQAGAEIHSDKGYEIGTQEKYEAFVKERNKSLAQARIKELWNYAADSTKDDSWKSQTAFIEEFAKLIIQECAQIAAMTPFPDADEEIKKTFGHTWDMACVAAAKDIRKYFGVEE